jgi:hypothetical protein
MYRLVTHGDGINQCVNDCSITTSAFDFRKFQGARHPWIYIFGYLSIKIGSKSDEYWRQIIISQWNPLFETCTLSRKVQRKYCGTLNVEEHLALYYFLPCQGSFGEDFAAAAGLTVKRIRESGGFFANVSPTFTSIEIRLHMVSPRGAQIRYLLTPRNHTHIYIYIRSLCVAVKVPWV